MQGQLYDSVPKQLPVWRRARDLRGIDSHAVDKHHIDG